MNGLSDPCPEAWLTQRQAVDPWAHRGHSAVRAVGGCSAGSRCRGFRSRCRYPAGLVIGGRARFELLVRCLTRLGTRPATSSWNGGRFGVVGSASHGDMNIDSVAVTDAELTPEDFDVLVQHRRQWNARPGQFHRR